MEGSGGLSPLWGIRESARPLCCDAHLCTPALQRPPAPAALLPLPSLPPCRPLSLRQAQQRLQRSGRRPHRRPSWLPWVRWLSGLSCSMASLRQMARSQWRWRSQPRKRLRSSEGLGRCSSVPCLCLLATRPPAPLPACLLACSVCWLPCAGSSVPRHSAASGRPLPPPAWPQDELGIAPQLE